MTDVTPTEIALPDMAARAIRNVCCNLWTGLRTAFFLRVQPTYLRVSALQLALLAFVLLLPPLIEQWWQIGAEGEFSSYGVPGALVVFSFGFVIAALVATFSRHRESFATLLTIFLSTAIVIDTLTIVLSSIVLPSIVLPVALQTAKLKSFYGSYYELLSRLPAYWLAMAIAVAWARLLATSRQQLRLISFFSALLIIILWESVWWDRTLWIKAHDDVESAEYLERYHAPVREEILYLQPQLLTRALDKLQSATDNASTHLYFLGFAPYASQNVFLREINSVTALFETRFTSPERSLTLINNAQTVRTAPFATKTALALSLQRFGKVMNTKNDVLFLYLTSHGSREHRLSVEFSPLQLDELTPADIKKMLDDAGIKWRVIAISACYSGGFINELQSDDALVITAAARDKTSFGCSDEESYTYFGRAYFDEALKQTNSFIDAFNIAKATVTAREKAEGYDPSNPQIALGKAIENKLREFEKQHNQSSTDKAISGESGHQDESNQEAVSH